jgi:steroid delta-isomerase-like uncharacterized protein
MPAEKNEAIVLTWVEEAWNRGHVDEQARILSPDYTWEELPPDFGSGPNGLLNFVRGFRAACLDLHFTIDEVVTNDDKVVWRCTGSGTQTGEFLGIPATGKRFSVSAIIISRFEGGLWREDHVCWDRLGMLQQLGVIPMPEGAAA